MAPVGAPAPVPNAPISSGTPRRGSRRAEIVIGLLIALVVVVGGAIWLFRQQAAQILSNVQSAIPTVYQPQPTVSVPAEEYQAAMGEAVSLQDGSGSDLGDVTVAQEKKVSKLADYVTADKGRVFAEAQVKYAARAEFSYNLYDWVAHDDAGTQYEPYGYFGKGSLESGTLATGRSVQGWVAFDIPKNTAHLWLDYQTYDGTVIFSVKLF
jgi:hypothetical protein